MNKVEKMVTANSGLSSKRVTAIVSLILLVMVVFAALFFNKLLPEYYVYSLVGLVAGAQAFTLFQQPRRHHYQQYDEHPPPYHQDH